MCTTILNQQAHARSNWFCDWDGCWCCCQDKYIWCWNWDNIKRWSFLISFHIWIDGTSGWAIEIIFSSLENRKYYRLGSRILTKNFLFGLKNLTFQSEIFWKLWRKSSSIWLTAISRTSSTESCWAFHFKIERPYDEHCVSHSRHAT